MNFLVLVAVHMENGKLPMYSVNARDHTSTALPSFSHDQHHETDAAKWKGGAIGRIEVSGYYDTT